MSRLWALIRAEFLNEFGSPVSLVFFLALPLLFTLAVGTGLRGMYANEGPPEEVRIPISVRLEDEGPLVTALLDTFAGVNLAPSVVEALPEDGFGLVVPPDFSEVLLGGGTARLTLHTLPNSSAGPVVAQAVRAAQSRVAGAVLVARAGVTQAQAAGLVSTSAEEHAFFEQVLEETLAATANPPAIAGVSWPTGTEIIETRDMTTSVEQASAGQLVTWVQITLLGAAEVLVSERLGGTLRRLLVTPASRSLILGGKLLARLLLGLLQMALLLIAGALFFGVNWGRDPAAVALVSLAFALATVSLGMLLATFVKTRGQAGSIVVGMSMALAALGGAWFPLEVTPPLYRQIAQVLPSTWAMRAYTDLLARRATIIDVLPYVGILFGFAVLFMGAAALRFSRYSED
jgi:ABC-2 type transport system permease protein